MELVVNDRPSWPAAAVCRVLPATLVGVAVGVLASEWSQLPPHRPGPLVIPMITGGIAMLGLVPEMLQPRGWDPAGYEGPAYAAGINGIVLGWLKARFGPVAAKLFVLAGSVGAMLATITTNTGSSTWSTAWPAILGSIAGAAALATLGGMVVRDYGRLVDSRTLTSSKLPKPRHDYSRHEI